MKKIGWNHRTRNEEVLHRVKEERNILRTIKWRRANWIGRNRLLEDVIEAEIEGGRERRRQRLLDQFQDARG